MAAVRDAQGRVTNFIGVQTDATERKNYELELQAAFEAAQAGDRAKSQFLAMMSHELRTPLQTVLGFAHLLLLDESGSLTPEQREDVLAIQQGAERMNELIQQLLDLTRFEAGKLTLASEPVDLAQLLNRVRHELAPLVAAKGLAFRVEVPPDLPEMLGDEVWLQRILLNLAGNAVKFTEDGSVTIRVAVSECEVAISVHDTGIGILPEDLPYIFDEFRQGDSSMTRRYEGAGLGLAISKRLAEQMNGTIEVESTPHVGSTFTLRLPLVCADDPQDAAHLNTAQAG
jgi:signal transduction histidine kinase